MSGGAFDYNQYKIGYIADQIDEVIVKNGLEKTHMFRLPDGTSDSILLRIHRLTNGVYFDGTNYIIRTTFLYRSRVI